MAELTEVLFGFKIQVGPRNHVLRWGRDCSMQRCSFHRKGHARACPMTLSWVVQKWLNWSRCRSGCGLEWAKAACIRWGAHWHNLANTIEPSMCGSDAAFFVRFLWPRVLLCNRISSNIRNTARRSLKSGQSMYVLKLWHIVSWITWC